jgi:hypothetical protein
MGQLLASQPLSADDLDVVVVVVEHSCQFMNMKIDQRTVFCSSYF